MLHCKQVEVLWEQEESLLPVFQSALDLLAGVACQRTKRQFLQCQEGRCKVCYCTFLEGEENLSVHAMMGEKCSLHPPADWHLLVEEQIGALSVLGMRVALPPFAFCPWSSGQKRFATLV